MASLIFYQNLLALDRNTHRKLKIKPQANGYGYAGVTNSVPVAAAEFGTVCHEYPIVFVQDENGGGVPLALLGLREGQNLYLNAQGQWDARYVPAFVRRYPYILQGDANAQQMLVLVDAGAEGFDHEQGERLFNDDGSNTALMDQTIAMLHSFSQAAEYSAGLVRRLRELDLLTARSINAVTPDGEKIQLNGVFAVDEVRLNALGDADLLGLARNGYLAAIHAHMISLYNIDRLIARLPAAA